MGIRVRLGRTGLTAEKNAFGALPIQRVSFETAEHLLVKAVGAGMDYIDTARAYSDSEEKIGRVLPSFRKDVAIATKTGCSTPETFWEHLHTSLSLLKTDYIDVYQFHNPAACPKPGDGSGLYEAMLEARSQGKIRFIGITAHKYGVAEDAVQSGLYDTLQFPLNYLSAQKDIDLAALCKEKDIGFIAMKAMSGGLITHSAAACAWLGQYENVLPIWGVQRESELDEFISYIANPPELTDELLAVIGRDRAELSGEFCRGCGYCMPGCPAEIQIFLCARMATLIRRSPPAPFLSESSQAMMNKIDDCTNCGQCAEKCPYGLDTPALLREHLADYREILAGRVTV
jgi:predicted aldo/keto reductase-like oxidoreductase